MKTIYYTAATLDGFIADPNHSLDWLFQFQESATSYEAFYRGVGALVMGSTTYEWIVNRTPGYGEPLWPYDVPAWVLTSRHLFGVKGADVRFGSGEVGPIHAGMQAAARGKNVWVVGGGEVAGQFYDRGLLDEIVVQVASVTLGSGSPLFPRRTQPPLQLVDVTRYGASFVELTYRVRYDEGNMENGA